MCEPVSLGIMAAAATVGAGASIIQGSKQLSAQRQAADQQRKDAERAFAEQERANNAANMKQPDISALVAAATRGGRAGNSSTFLTGAAGVNPSNLALGRASLLGA